MGDSFMQGHPDSSVCLGNPSRDFLQLKRRKDEAENILSGLAKGRLGSSSGRASRRILFARSGESRRRAAPSKGTAQIDLGGTLTYTKTINGRICSAGPCTSTSLNSNASASLSSI